MIPIDFPGNVDMRLNLKSVCRCFFDPNRELVVSLRHSLRRGLLGKGSAVKVDLERRDLATLHFEDLGDVGSRRQGR